MKHRHTALALGCAALAGCASFDGMPEPIFAAKATVDDVTQTFPFDGVVVAMAGKEAGPRKIYRNRVAASYLMAIDARYFEFRRRLSRNVKGGNLGFDIALLGLTGTAAMFEKAADELAAAATGVAGARASLNRELYFERTLPALIGLMDAQRLEVRTAILRGLKESEDRYTVQELFADLARYEAAASLDGAIQKVSQIAGVEAAKAELDFSDTIELCEAPDDVAEARMAYAKELHLGRTTPAGQARNARAAVVAGLAGAEPTNDASAYAAQQQAIADALLEICTAETLATFKQQVDQDP